FYLHPGVDPIAIARALAADLRAHAAAQGASTLTQQLAKNAFLSPRRTLSRKLREAVLALLLEAHASKEEILARYVASVYLGVDGGLPVHGFSQAAQVYFGKPLGDLDPAECALLAGIIRSPNGLSPRRHPRAALARRNRVLELMVRGALLERSAGGAGARRSRRRWWRSTRPPAACARWWAAATTARARSIGRCAPTASRARPSSRSCTWPRSTPHAGVRPSRAPSCRRSRTRRSPCASARGSGSPPTTTAPSRARSRSRTRSPSRATRPRCAWRSTSASTRWRARPRTSASPSRCRACRPSRSAWRRPRSSS